MFLDYDSLSSPQLSFSPSLCLSTSSSGLIYFAAVGCCQLPQDAGIDLLAELADLAVAEDESGPFPTRRPPKAVGGLVDSAAWIADVGGMTPGFEVLGHGANEERIRSAVFDIGESCQLSDFFKERAS